MTQDRERRRRSKRLMLLVFMIVLTIAASVVLTVDRSEPPVSSGVSTPTAVSEAPASTTPNQPRSEATTSAGLDRLPDSIDTILDEASDYRIGLALVDVSGDVERTFGDQGPYTAASTAKIITAAAYYSLVEAGEAGLDEAIGDNDAASHLEAMINRSDNDSWLLLMNAVGYPQLIDYAASIGITYDPEENLLTPAQMALVLKQLYAGELLNADHTAQLLSYMQDTNNEDLIPAGSRDDIEVFHKYGQLWGRLHDAALLTDDDSTFVLVIYTENPVGTESSAQVGVIRDLTRAVEDALFPPPQEWRE